MSGKSTGWTQGLLPFSGAAEVMAKFSAKLWPKREDAQGGETNADEGTPSDEEESDHPVSGVTTGVDQSELGTTKEIDEASETTDHLEHSLRPEDLTDEAGLPAKREDSPTNEVARSIPYPEVDAKACKIGMSACLMGHEVRYNQGHCRARNIMEGMNKVFTFVPVCPEVDIGLGVPRPTLRLVANAKLTRNMDIEEIQDKIQLWCPEKEADYTDSMDSYTKAKVTELRNLGIDGFILKKDSPSCGISAVKLYESKAELSMGRKLYKGLFARGLMKQWPELPVTDEGRLNDEDVRNNFVQHVLCHQKWRAHDGSFKAVVNFHASHKYTLLAQSPAVLKELGTTLAKGPKYFAENNIRQVYYSKFFSAMKVLVGRGRHTNVLCHLAGHLRGSLDAELYQDLNGSIQDFQEGLVPLVVPLRLLQIYSKAVPGKDALQTGSATGSDGEGADAIPAYIQGAPRSLKAYTAISNRTESKLPNASNVAANE